MGRADRAPKYSIEPCASFSPLITPRTAPRSTTRSATVLQTKILNVTKYTDLARLRRLSVGAVGSLCNLRNTRGGFS